MSGQPFRALDRWHAKSSAGTEGVAKGGAKRGTKRGAKGGAKGIAKGGNSYSLFGGYTYYVRGRTFDVLGVSEFGNFGKWSAVKKVKIPA